MTKRNVSKNVKISVLLNHNYKCNHCKDDLKDHQWECDHILPLWNGGRNEFVNLQALCANCHAEKTYFESLERAKLKRARAQEKHEEERLARFCRYGFDDLTQYVYTTGEAQNVSHTTPP